MWIILFQEAAKIRFGYENASNTGPGFKDNFAQIGVYFQSLNTKKIVEEPKYTVRNIGCFLEKVLIRTLNVFYY